MNVMLVSPNITFGLANIFISISMNIMLILPNITSGLTNLTFPIHQSIITSGSAQIGLISPANLLQ